MRTESVPPPSYADIPGLGLRGVLQLHLSLFLGFLRPIDALDPVRSEFETADLVRASGRGMPPMVLLNTARAVRTVFGAPSYSFRTASEVGVSLLGAKTVFAIDGAEHQRHRRLIMPSFHDKSIQSYGRIIAESTRRVAAECPLDENFPIHPPMQEITLQAMLRILLGSSDEKRYRELQPLFRDFLGAPLLAACLFFKPLQIDLGAWSPWGRLVRLQRRLSEILLAEITDRRRQGAGDDVLGFLVTAHDEAGQTLSDHEVHDELLALMFAANEATAASLAWAIYWVHRDPEVRDRVLTELTEAGPDPDPLELARLPYLSAVCNETLRVSPVTLLAIPRVTEQAFELLDYRVEPGVMLTPCIYLVHRDPEVYPDPQAFKPERFLDRRYSPFEFIPFGGGHRRCAGAALASFEMNIVLAEMLRELEFSLVSEAPAAPERHGTTFVPAEGLRVTARRRAH